MPTAIATTTAAPAISLKASSNTTPSSSAAATLRSLYPRAARAFLQRDVPLTHSLLSSAFSLIQPPISTSVASDTLASARRKWDILRITFETTLYASPPSSQDPELLPSALRANLMLSAESLIASVHTRSLQLFTPADSFQKASSAFLPAQILVTLVLASLKLDCTEVGRGIIEDWLAKHGQEVVGDDPKGYIKVLELYCLHVLPRLQDWEYAEEFLTYETELPHDVRQQFTTSLGQLRAEAATAAHVQTTLPPDPSPSSSSSSSPSRTPSPTPSDSSASSSSTHTATPRSSYPNTNGHLPSSLTPLTPYGSQSPTPIPHDKGRDPAPPHSASSSSIASTATSRTITPHTAERARTGKPRHANGHARPAVPQNESRSPSATPAGRPIVRRTSSGAPVVPYTRAGEASRAPPPSTLALIRASLQSMLQGTSRSRVFLYAMLFVFVPIVSFVFRVRRRRARADGASVGNVGSGTVDAVRRRLRGIDGQGNIVGKLWGEVARAVLDTVRMAGRGLV